MLFFSFLRPDNEFPAFQASSGGDFAAALPFSLPAASKTLAFRQRESCSSSLFSAPGNEFPAFQASSGGDFAAELPFSPPAAVNLPLPGLLRRRFRRETSFFSARGLEYPAFRRRKSCSSSLSSAQTMNFPRFRPPPAEISPRSFLFLRPRPLNSGLPAEKIVLFFSSLRPDNEFPAFQTSSGGDFAAELPFLCPRAVNSRVSSLLRRRFRRETSFFSARAHS